MATLSERIRVVLVDMHRLLRDILHEVLDGQPDMEVVNEEVGVAEFLRSIVEFCPDVVIVGDEVRRADLDCMIERCPSLAAVVIASDGGHALVYRLRREPCAIPDVTPTRLVETLRSVTSSSGLP